MKKLFLLILIVSISFPALAFLGFGEDEEEVCKPQPKATKCNYAVSWKEDERGRNIYMIFSVKTLGKCEKMSHAGVLDEVMHYYEKYAGQSKIRWGNYGGASGHREVIKESWGDLNLVEVYEGPSSPIPQDE